MELRINVDVPRPAFRSARLAVVAVVLTFAWASAATAADIVITEYGLYDTAMGGTKPALKTVTGKTNVITRRRLLRRSHVIAAMPGRSFGVQYRITGSLRPADRLTYRILHPPLTNPKTGATMTVSEWSGRVGGNLWNRYIGYSFDHGWEMGEGLWTIQILRDGRVLAEKTFKIVVPLN